MSSGTSKGRGFTGVMKRHNFAGAGTVGHGTHEYKRHGGSIGHEHEAGSDSPRSEDARPGTAIRRSTILNLRIVKRSSRGEHRPRPTAACPVRATAVITVKGAIKKAPVPLPEPPGQGRGDRGVGGRPPKRANCPVAESRITTVAALGARDIPARSVYKLQEIDRRVGSVQEEANTFSILAPARARGLSTPPRSVVGASGSRARHRHQGPGQSPLPPQAEIRTLDAFDGRALTRSAARSTW